MLSPFSGSYHNLYYDSCGGSPYIFHLCKRILLSCQSFVLRFSGNRCAPLARTNRFGGEPAPDKSTGDRLDNCSPSVYGIFSVATLVPLLCLADLVNSACDGRPADRYANSFNWKSLSEISIGEQKIYIFKRNIWVAFSFASEG